MLKRGIWIFLIILFSFNVYGQVKEAENFIIATDDKGPVSDVILVSDIISALRFKGYSFSQNSSNLFSEIDALRLDNSTLVAIYNGDARVVVGIYASPKLADDISEVLKDKKISFEVFLSNEIKTSNLKDLFEETVNELKGDFDKNSCVEFNDFTQFSKAFGECNNQNVTVVSNLEKLVIDNINFEVNILDSITGFNNTIGFFSDKENIIIRVGERKNLTENSYVRLEKIEDKKAFIVISFCDKKFDLSGSNEIDIEDFLIFAGNYGSCEEIKEQPDVDILNLKNGQILTSGEFKLDIKTKDKSLCGYGLFKEVAAKLTSDLGIPFETSNGFLHNAKFEDLRDGKYLLFIKCDANGVVKESSLNFKVELKGINAEISIAAIRDQYWDDQRIELTDPPEEKSETSSFSQLSYDVPKVSRISESDVYIVEFLDDSLIRKRLQMEENRGITQLRNELNSLKAAGKLALGKRAALAFNELGVNNDLRNELEKIEELHDEFKNDLLKLSLPKNAAAKPAPIETLFEYSKAFNGVAIRANPEIVEEIKELPYVKKVEKEKFFEPFLIESTELIGANYAWENVIDNEGLPVTGKGVKIAVIDTGVDYTHPDLGGCTTEQFLEKKCGKVVGGYDFGDNDPDPIDDSADPGHGTHVASTIAGKGVLNGVAPDADIYAYKIAGQNGRLRESSILAAWEAITDLDDDGVPFENKDDMVDVVSMSFGSRFGDPDDTMSRNVDDLVDGGIVAVVSAGNSGPGKGTIGSPGTSRKAITVGASYKIDYKSFEFECSPGEYVFPCGDFCGNNGKVLCNYWGDGNPKVDQVVAFSSRGPMKGVVKPEIVAPGAVICAARHDSIFERGKHPYYYSCVDEQHVQLAGTSMSAPIVSGAVALLLQKNPDWTPFEIKQALKNTAKDLGLDVNIQGAGRIDIKKAVELVSPPPIISEININQDMVDVFGSVKTEFKLREIYIRSAESNEWNLVFSSSEPIKESFLGSFNVSSFDPGTYNMELRVLDEANKLLSKVENSFEIKSFFVNHILPEEGIDTNNNGLYDLLRIKAEIYSKVEGKNLVAAVLLLGEERGIFDSIFIPLSKDFDLVKGLNIVEFNFPGVKIKKRFASFEINESMKLFAIFGIKEDPDILKRGFELNNKYIAEDFERTVDVSPISFFTLDKRLYYNTEGKFVVEIHNLGTEPLKTIVSIYKKKSDDEYEVVHEESIKEDKFYDESQLEFEYTPDKDGLQTFRVITDAEGDINKENDILHSEFKVYPNGPDVEGHIGYSPDLVFGKTSKISIYVENLGNVDAKDVKISLTATNQRTEEVIPIGEKVIDKIKMNEDKKIIFDWVPNINGRVIVNMDIQTEDDIDLGNNNDVVFVDVVSNAPELSTYVQSDYEIPIYIETTANVFLRNRGLKNAENATHSFTILKDEKLIYGENDSFISIESNKEIIIPFTWAPNELGEYLLKSEIYIEGDENPENNMHSRFVDVLPNASDVSGWYNWNIDKLIFGQTYDLEFYVRNAGFAEAENISILLFKNDNLIDGRILDRLKPRENNKTTLRWAPKKEDIGWNNLKLVVDADNDANPENNENDFSLKVLSDQADVSVYIYSREDFVVNKENDLIVRLENEGGKDAEDVDLFLYLKNKITGEEELLVNKKFGSVDAGSFTEWYFSYTPEEIGIERFKAVISYEDDVNLGNNQIERDIKIVPQSRLRNLGNDDLFGHLLIEIQRKEGNEWKSHTVLIDDLKNAGRSRTIGSNSVLALDELVNREFGVIRIEDEGDFRIYVAFLDVDGNIIKTMDDKKLEARYQFNKRNYRSKSIPENPNPGWGGLS